MHPAIELREILRQIVEHLHHDAGSLRSAMLVSRTWAEEACAVLWREPPVKALASVAPERRQLYASMIQRLVFFGHLFAEESDALDGVQFPRLVELESCSSAEWRTTFAGRCPRLHTLIAPFGHGAAYADAIALLHTNAATLESVSLSMALPQPALAQLAGLPRLRKLSLRGVISHPAAPPNPAASEPPLLSPFFPALRVMSVDGEVSAVLRLLQLAPPSAVVRLYVAFPATHSANDMSAFAAFSRLEKLTIVFPEARRLRAENVLALGRLTALRRLEIVMDSGRNPGAGFCDITDRDFAQFVSGLRELRVFNFNLDSALSAAALQSIGTHCPAIEEIGLAGAIALDALPLSGGRPLFPRLRGLILERFEPRAPRLDAANAHEVAAQIMRVLKHHAPLLEDLQFQDIHYGLADIVDDTVRGLWLLQNNRDSEPPSP